jgi:YHS domain-containing protein
MKTALRLLITALALTTFALVVSARPALACPCNDKKSNESKAGEAPKSAPAQDAAPKYFDKKQPDGTKATCPVMGDVFTITKDSTFSEYKGKVVYFCCPGCKPKFDKDPAKYLPDLK